MPPIDAQILPAAKVLAAALIFFGSYIVFAIGTFPRLKIDRPGAAIIGAVLMVAFGIVVLAIVLTGFLAGLPPALVAAVGAALLLITRTVEPRRMYEGVDWGLLVFFVGLFIIVGGADRAGLTDARFNLRPHGICTGSRCSCRSPRCSATSLATCQR